MLVKEASNICDYCGCSEMNLEWEHIIPKSRGGLDMIDNMVLCCKKCNLAKSEKDVFEWYGKEKRYDVPRLVLGKYLKLVFDAHGKSNTLDSTDPHSDGCIDIFDIGSVFSK